MELSSYYGRSSLCTAIEEWGEPDIEDFLAIPASTAGSLTEDGRVRSGILCACRCGEELTYKAGSGGRKWHRERSKFKRGHYLRFRAGTGGPCDPSQPQRLRAKSPRQ